MHSHTQDIPLYAAFVMGALLFALKRAGMAMRSKMNMVSTRRAYFAMNWDILLIRWGLEVPMFWYWLHYDLTEMLQGAFGLHLSVHVPIIPMTAFMFGYLADSLLDWVSQWNKLPASIREQIPRANGPTTPTT